MMRTGRLLGFIAVMVTGIIILVQLEPRKDDMSAGK
jgi:hypothetical protein